MMPPRTLPPRALQRTEPAAASHWHRDGRSEPNETSLADAQTPQGDSGWQRFLGGARGVGVAACLSCLALWAAFPPLGMSFLVWCAPLGLIWLIDRQEGPGRSGYFWIWIAACAFWLAILQGIRLAFWPLVFGWIALALYLAVYMPLFVGVARIIRHRWQWSLAWSAPVAWTGLELCRSYMLTGYAANTLAHTQYRHPLVIQAADQWGGYGVSFVIIAVSVGIYRALGCMLRRSIPNGPLAQAPAGSRGDLLIPACWLSALLGYGYWRLAEGDRLSEAGAPLLRVALIQENTPSMFDANPERLQQAWTRYAAMTSQAIREHGAVDLIVWPESTFTAMIPWMEDQTIDGVPAEMVKQKFDRQSLRSLVMNYQNEFKSKTRTLLDIIRGSLPPQATAAARTSQPYLLVGNDAMVFKDDRVGRYNAALLLDPLGKVTARYEKIHLVMFGEYIPLEWALGFLGEAFGFSSATAGTEAQTFTVNGVRIAPSICFESTLPQMTSWQMRTLVARGQTPDVLVNITNDSWFHGSSILDHHLACDVLAAVEMRRPFLIAANTGLSAWIEGSGRIRQVSPRLEPYSIVASPVRDSRWGLTQLWGDAPAWCLAAVCLLALLSGCAALWQRPRRFGRRSRETAR